MIETILVVVILIAIVIELVIVTVPTIEKIIPSVNPNKIMV